MSDFRLPKEGERVIVASVEEGDLYVARVDSCRQEVDKRPIAILSDGSPWLADTGEPLNRGNRGQRLWNADEGYLRGKIREATERILSAEPTIAGLGDWYNTLLRMRGK